MPKSRVEGAQEACTSHWVTGSGQGETNGNTAFAAEMEACKLHLIRRAEQDSRTAQGSITMSPSDFSPITLTFG